MRRWSETAERVTATSRTSEKVRLLAEYLRTLTPAELPTAVTFFTGRPFPERDPRVLGLGWAAIDEVVQAEADAAPGALGRAYDRSSDLGRAVFDVLDESRRRPSGELPTLTDVRDTFAAIAAASGAEAKAVPFRTLLWRSDPLVAKYHCIIEEQAETFVLTDLGARSGVFVTCTDFPVATSATNTWEASSKFAM